MGEVPNGTWVTGEVLCSPGLAGQNRSLAVVDKSLYYEVPSFSMSHFLSSSGFGLVFFSVLASIKIEKTFFLTAVLFGKIVLECLCWIWSGCVENGVWLLFSAPSICSSHCPSVGLGPDQFVPLINSFLLIYNLLCALAKTPWGWWYSIWWKPVVAFVPLKLSVVRIYFLILQTVCRILSAI